MRCLTWLTALAVLVSSLACSALEPGGRFRSVVWDELPVSKAPHRVGLLDSGWEALALRVHLIRTAERTLDMQTFIWADDEVGRLMVHELVAAARRGVRVRLLADQMFSTTEPDLVAYVSTAHENLLLQHYNPNRKRIAPSALSMLPELMLRFEDVNQRMHDKVMVVDGRIAIVGGRNLENAYFDYAEGMNFKDREMVVEGPVIEDIVTSFERFWVHVRSIESADLIDVARLLRSGRPLPWETPEQLGITGLLDELALWSATGVEVVEDYRKRRMSSVEQVLFSCDQPGKPWLREGEDGAPRELLRVLGGLVRGARESVLVQSPYLVLGQRGARLFEDMRADEPELVVRVSTNSLAATDSWPTYAMSYRQKRLMIETLGFQIHEYKPYPGDLQAAFSGHQRAGDPEAEPRYCLHSKSLVLDGQIAAVGSFNLDPRSSDFNTEVMLLVRDERFAEELTRSIETDIHPRNSWTVWKREHPLIQEQMVDLLDFFSRAIASVTTLDPWPSQYASAFEMRGDCEPLEPTDPRFYDCYLPIGNFPGVSPKEEKLLYTLLFKTFATSTNWLL